MASDSLTIKFRPTTCEDLWPNSFTVLSQYDFDVLGVGNQVPLTPIISAISDAAALATGLQYGDTYLNVGLNPIRLRAITATSSAATAFSGAASLAGGTISDGTAAAIGTIAVGGATQSAAVAAASTSLLVTGVRIVSKVSSPGVTAVEIWNLSGFPVTLGTIPFAAQALASVSAGSVITKLSAVAIATTGGVIGSGTVASIGAISVPGATLGNPVLCNTNPPLPTGVMMFGQVTSSGVVTVEIWNLSAFNYGGPVSLGAGITALTSGMTGSVLNELLGGYAVTIGPIDDGTSVSVGAVGVPGAVPANTVIVEATPSLPTGVQSIAKVTAIGMVAIEIWNLSGSTYTPGTITFNVTVLQ